MTKEYFIELADYHIWANNAVCNWLEQISDEQWKQSVLSSFSSIYETTLHTAAAEKVWVERLKKYSKFEILTQTFNGSKAEMINLWKEISQSFKNFIEEMPDDLLQQKLLFKNIKGIEHNLPHYQLIAHVINHSTYHRGQLVTMLRQVGFTDVSSIDMTTYFRIKNDLPQEVLIN
ncbi:MAG: DinB family protein [Ginsengibacter sp.]